MNVYMSKFWPLLPDAIEDISNADYVAIDLEMTGIERRGALRLQNPTMVDIYQRARKAAETFNVLQFGLTCLRFDQQSGTYVANAYNFHVSPMFQMTRANSNGGLTTDSHVKTLARLLDRTLVVSVSTMLFLKSNGIRLEDSYKDGIHYLSRQEEAEVRPLFFHSEQDKRADIDVTSQDAETQEFYNDVRSKMLRWEQEATGSYINISNPHGGRLNRFQRRLVHQMLDVEFPNKYFATTKADDFMQIMKGDNKKEIQRRRDEAREREVAIRSQRGLRYIFEVLAGGDFADETTKLLDPENVIESNSDASRTIHAQLQESQEKLLKKQPVLIGHNMLHDLCFTYATFIGNLPDSLEGFNDAIHKLFPRIIDTKYLATQGQHDMMSDKSLGELYDIALQQQDGPIVRFEKPVEYNKPDTRNAHHAGFDSSMTAMVMVKQAWDIAQKEDGPDFRMEGGQLPEWDDRFFQTYGNKIRIGSAGILEFGTASPPAAVL